MKRTLPFAIALMAIGCTLQAQSSDVDPREQLAFGVKAGFNLANVWDEQGQDFNADPKLGFAGGAFVGIPLGKFLGLQPELLLSQKGFRGSGTLFGLPYKFRRTSTYLDVPIQIQIKPLSVLTVVMGPQFSFLMYQKDVFKAGESTVVQEQAFENDKIRRNILGFVAGADVVVKHVVISGRLGWDLFNNNGDGTTSTPRYKNRWVQLTLGFQI